MPFFFEKCPSEPGPPNFSKLPTPLLVDTNFEIEKILKLKKVFLRGNGYGPEFGKIVATSWKIMGKSLLSLVYSVYCQTILLVKGGDLHTNPLITSIYSPLDKQNHLSVRSLLNHSKMLHRMTLYIGT